MKNKFSKITLLLSIIFFCTFLIVLILFYGKINNSNKESLSKELEWQTEAQRRNDIKALDNSVKVIEGDNVQLQTHFAQSSDIVPFLDTIEELGPKTGVIAVVDSVDTGGNNSGLYVGMKVSGTFPSLYKFLTLLENSPYELEFTSVAMHKETVPPDLSKKNVKVVSNWNLILKMKLLSFVQ